MAAKQCAYQHGDVRCKKWAVGKHQFCSEHAHALPKAVAAEANALEPSVARALREELGVKNQEVASGIAVDSSGSRRKGTAVSGAQVPDLPPEAQENPIAYAMKLAMDAVADAYAADNEERAMGRQRMSRSPTDRARTTLAAYMPDVADDTAMIGEESGESLVRPGWISRWVRDRDEQGRPDSRRLRKFYAQGAEDVLDESGRPLISRFGRAIQMPPALYAARVLQYSSPGAFDNAPPVQEAIDMAEQMNRRLGRTVYDVRPAAEHGSRRGGPW